MINDIKGSTHTAYYKIWYSIHNRCGRLKNYTNCVVCEEWQLLSNFKQWFDKSNYKPTLEIDKDILVKGNVTYGPKTCTFVSSRINLLITDRKNFRGKDPIGCTYQPNKHRYKVVCNENGKLKHIGYFKNKDDAINAYKTFKEIQIKKVATEEYQLNNITKEVYDSLMSWTI